MECNKDEAVRAKEISEKKLLERDITGAQKFALKAHNLFPNLDGLSQLLEIIDFYIAHDKKINGEPDYYGIVGVDPLADEETLKKQYKRMALSLHPDKNKSVGADGAFKILSQAWSVLSNKDTRNAYNSSRMNVISSYHMSNLSSSNLNSHRVPTRPRTPVTTSGMTFQNVPLPRAPRKHPSFSLHQSRLETFWTLCNRCKIQYKYQKVYLNQKLLCPRCHQPFLATEMPALNLNSSTSRPWLFPEASCKKSSDCLKKSNEEAVNMKNRSTVLEKVEEASASASNAASSGREKPKKRKRRDDHKNESAKERNKGSGLKRQSTNLKELSQIEIRAMLIRKAKMEIIGWINEPKTEKPKSFDTEDDSMSVPLKNDSVDSRTEDQKRDGLHSDLNNTSQPQKSFTLEEKDDPDETVISMVVPDASFHNFDDDRIEKSFAENQIWAAYDDDDGMPRYYALIHHVISRNPFKMQISWLNSKSSSEFGSVDWIGCGFTKTAGDFRVGKSVVSKRLNSFSHPIKWRKGARGVIQIFPTKGEVWALYRNWSPDWDEVTSDEIIHKYDLVVVLQEYSEDTGFLVAPLVKVAGFTSVFNQLLDQRDFRTINREEMFRFSHQVPFYILNGQEAENSPKSCYELDPAALPLELLNVITDDEAKAMQRASELPVMVRGLEVEAEAMEESTSAERRRVFKDAKCILTYSRKRKGKENQRGY